MGLTDTVIKNAKWSGKDFKLYDVNGLFVLVKKAGKYFRMDYRFAGKRNQLRFGVYPEVSLKEAREKRDEARKLIRDGIDPSAEKKAKKIQIATDVANTFQAVAAEWYEKMKGSWTEKHGRTKLSLLETYIFPVFGKAPIKNITTRELLTILENIQTIGVIDTAHRVKNVCGEVFKYGVATSKCERDPSQDIIKDALIPKRVKHMATITDPKKVGALLRAIDGYQGGITTICALKLTPYLLLRPGELRHMEWSEIDFDDKLLRIPMGKMKMRRIHIVPLAEQAIAILKQIQSITGHGKYIFPSLRSSGRPMSENTITAALRRMGFPKEEMTAHGFRSMASTLLYEHGYRGDVIEMQLAHAERNKVKGSYNHAEYLDERKDMMQWFADYLDSLKEAKPSS